LDLALLKWQDSSHHPQKGGFSRPVRPNQPQDGPFVEVNGKANDAWTGSCSPWSSERWCWDGVPVLNRLEGKNCFRHGQIHGKPSLQPWREANLYGGRVEIGSWY
jgi:hypothetical protein